MSDQPCQYTVHTPFEHRPDTSGPSARKQPAQSKRASRPASRGQARFWYFSKISWNLGSSLPTVLPPLKAKTSRTIAWKTPNVASGMFDAPASAVLFAIKSPEWARGPDHQPQPASEIQPPSECTTVDPAKSMEAALREPAPPGEPSSAPPPSPNGP